MKAMIFDCERLKRVLEEERRYFRELCQTEEKGHADRLRELQSIRENIKKEEDSSTCSIRLIQLQLGMMRLAVYFGRKVRGYEDAFLREECKEVKIVKIGVKSLDNCCRIGSLKMQENKRNFFRTWHSRVFPKSVLRELTERAMCKNEESRLRLRSLSAMEEGVL